MTVCCSLPFVNKKFPENEKMVLLFFFCLSIFMQSEKNFYDNKKTKFNQSDEGTFKREEH
jgi:hypothetical protein